MAPGKINEQHGPFVYQPLIYKSYLGKHETLLLGFYSWAYNWTEGKGSYYSKERITQYLNMSPKTYLDARRKLESLGWIHTSHEYLPGHDHVSIRVRVLLGNDDPDLLAKNGGRHLADQEAYEKLRANFASVHPNLAGKPKYRKLCFSIQSQSIAVQKQRLEGKNVATNYELYELINEDQ